MPSRDHIGHARTQPEVGRSVDGCPAGTRAPSRHRRALASGTVPGVRLEARRGGVERRFWPAIATPREQDAAPGLRERVDVRASGRRCGAANRPTLDGVSPPRTTGSHSDIDKTRRSQPAPFERAHAPTGGVGKRSNPGPRRGAGSLFPREPSSVSPLPYRPDRGAERDDATDQDEPGQQGDDDADGSVGRAVVGDLPMRSKAKRTSQQPAREPR